MPKFCHLNRAVIENAETGEKIETVELKDPDAEQLGVRPVPFHYRVRDKAVSVALEHKVPVRVKVYGVGVCFSQYSNGPARTYKILATEE